MVSLVPVVASVVLAVVAPSVICDAVEAALVLLSVAAAIVALSVDAVTVADSVAVSVATAVDASVAVWAVDSVAPEVVDASVTLAVDVDADSAVVGASVTGSTMPPPASKSTVVVSGATVDTGVVAAWVEISTVLSVTPAVAVVPVAPCVVTVAEPVDEVNPSDTPVTTAVVVVGASDELSLTDGADVVVDILAISSASSLRRFAAKSERLSSAIAISRLSTTLKRPTLILVARQVDLSLSKKRSTLNWYVVVTRLMNGLSTEPKYK